MSNAHRAALTWPALLVVLLIITVLAGMVIPARWVLRERSHQGSGCGNNQRQILLGMAVYANDNDQAWPVLTTDTDGRHVPFGDPRLDGTATAIASLEMMDWVVGGDLTPGVFACPSARQRRPATAAQDGLGATVWSSAWAAAGPSAIGYSYDWSAPPKAQSQRVMTADRHRTLHRTGVMASFADGHVGYIAGTDGQHLNRDAANDEIYDGIGDGPMATPGMGSTTRAWVR